MVCYDSGLVIHVTHLRNMLFICILIFQKLDVNLHGFFFSFEKQKQNCSPSFFTCYQGSAVAPFHVSSDHSPEKRAGVLKQAFRLPWGNWACSRQCFWNAPQPPQCSAVPACLLRTAVRADDPFLVTKEVTYVFCSPPFHRRLPQEERRRLCYHEERCIPKLDFNG